MAQQARKLIRTFTGGQITKIASHLLDTPENASGVTCENVDITAGTLASAKSPRFVDIANGEAVTWFKNYFSFFEKGTTFTDLLKMKVALRPDGLLYYTKDGKTWHKLQVIRQPKTAFIEHNVNDRYKPVEFTPVKREKVYGYTHYTHEAGYYGPRRWYHKTSVNNYIKGRYYDIALPYSPLTAMAKVTIPKNISFSLGKDTSFTGSNTSELFSASVVSPSFNRGLDHYNGKGSGELKCNIAGVTKLKEDIYGYVSEATGQAGYIVVPVIMPETLSLASLNDSAPLQILRTTDELAITATIDGKEIFNKPVKFNKTTRYMHAEFTTQDGKQLVVDVKPSSDANYLVLLEPVKDGVVKKKVGFINVSPMMLHSLLDSYLYANLNRRETWSWYTSGWIYDDFGHRSGVDCRCNFSCTRKHNVFEHAEKSITLPSDNEDIERVIRAIALDMAEVSMAESVITANAITVNETKIAATTLGFLDEPTGLSISLKYPKLDGIYGEFSYTITIYDEHSDFETGPSGISGPFKCGDIVDGKEFKDELPLSLELPDLGTYNEDLKVRIYRLGSGTTKFRLLKEIPIKDFIAEMYYDSKYHFVDNTPASELGQELITRDNIDVEELTSITNYYGQLFASKDNLVLWSRENRPEYWDASSYMTFDNEVVGCAAAMEGVLVFTSLRTYILIGQGSAMYKQLLSETTGCISQGSICVGGNTVVWQAQTGLILYSGGQLQPLTYQKLAEPLPLITSSFFSNGKYFGITEEGKVIVIDGLNGYAILWYDYGMPVYSGVNVRHEEFLTDGRQLLVLDGQPLPMKWKSQRLATTLGVVKNYKTLLIYCENTRGLQANIYVNGKIATNVALHDGCNQIKIAQASRLGYFLNVEFIGIGDVIEVQMEDEENQNAI